MAAYDVLDDGTELAFGAACYSSDEEEHDRIETDVPPSTHSAIAHTGQSEQFVASICDAVAKWCKPLSSQFAVGYHYDMLHDLERNDCYRRAIAEAVLNEDDFVLEIGSGSGLLALIASEASCQHVFTVEGDPMMAVAAKRVVEANERSHKVTVLPKFSTDVQVGWSADLPSPASVLVAEIFDTQLVGEGVLPSFIDAHARLLEPGARVVPHRGRIFAAAMRSRRLSAMDQLGESSLASLLGSSIQPEDYVSSGPSAVFQCQAGDLLRKGTLELLSEPVEALTLEFACPAELHEEYDVTTSVKLSSEGPVDGVLMWWTLDMNPSGSVQLSTSPFDAEGQGQPPRYHWQQGASIFSKPLCLSVGDSFELRALVRGGWDLFFEPLLNGSASGTITRNEFSFPNVPRPRLFQLSDETRIHSYKSQIESALMLNKSKPRSLALCLGDGWVGLVAALAVCDEVLVCTFSLQAAESIRRILALRADEKRVRVVLHDDGIAAAVESLAGAAPDVVVCEPYHNGFATSGTSWGFEEIILLKNALSELIAKGIPRTCPVVPRIKAVARVFELPEYFRRRQLVGHVEGFDLSEFNEAAPLWRQFDVKRQTMAGWNPTWHSGRMQSAVNWLDPGEIATEPSIVSFSGSLVGTGAVHAAIIWLEDSERELDPLDLPLTGCITFRTAKEIRSQEGYVSLNLSCTSPDDLTCSVTFDGFS